MTDPLRARVDASLTALGMRAPDDVVGRLAVWASLVDQTNQRIDLTAARDADELVDLLLADAIVLASRIREGISVVDVGTGAGAPGVPLALLRPDLDVALVEPMDKRVSFLRTSVGTFFGGRDRLPRVVRGRGEALVGKEELDAAISRATLPPAEWLALGRSLAPRGEVWVLLARGEPPESGARDVVQYEWPLTKVSRTAVVY